MKAKIYRKAKPKKMKKNTSTYKKNEPKKYSKKGAVYGKKLIYNKNT